MAQPAAFADELERVSADLDRLIADRRSMGRPSHARHEDHVDQAEELAARLRRAARGPGRPHHAPLGRTSLGLCW